MNNTLLYIAMGVAFLLAAIYFYCTYRNIITYDDNEVNEVNNNNKVNI